MQNLRRKSLSHIFLLFSPYMHYTLSYYFDHNPQRIISRRVPPQFSHHSVTHRVYVPVRITPVELDETKQTRIVERFLLSSFFLICHPVRFFHADRSSTEIWTNFQETSTRSSRTFARYSSLRSLVLRSPLDTLLYSISSNYMIYNQ